MPSLYSTQIKSTIWKSPRKKSRPEPGVKLEMGAEGRRQKWKVWKRGKDKEGFTQVWYTKQ